MDVFAFCSSVSKTTIHRILRDRRLHPYKYVRVQQLLARDYIQRVQYSRWLLGEVLRNPSFNTYILWTDEAIFNREGCFNSHNMHVWSDENPLALRPRAAQVRWSINLWAGICGEFIVGPYSLPDGLDGPAYKYFLEHVLPDLMDDIPYEIRQNMYYQQDGAGPHFANIVRAYLGETFQDRWIGHGGQEAHVAWPPRSPDMNPLDFFFWGYLKVIWLLLLLFSYSCCRYFFFLLTFCICCTTIISEWGVSSAGGHAWGSNCAYPRSGGKHIAANITGRPKTTSSPRWSMRGQWGSPCGATHQLKTIGPFRGHQFFKRRNNMFHKK